MNKQNVVIEFPSETWVINRYLPYCFDTSPTNIKKIQEYLEQEELNNMYKRNGCGHLAEDTIKILQKHPDYTCFQLGDIHDAIFDVGDHRIDVIFSMSLN